MPTYDYLCSACDHKFEELQNISAQPLQVCPSCGQSALKRLVGGGAGIIFKGSGFYVTDSKPSISAGKSSGSNGSDGKSGSSMAETTGESSTSGKDGSASSGSKKADSDSAGKQASVKDG